MPLDERAIAVVQGVNEELRQMVSAHPDRFSAFATLPGLLPAGARLVKAFGTLSAPSLAAAARREPDRAARMHGMYQPDEQYGHPCKGTKRARIDKASGYTHR